jgi:formylglycine-generating enzyme required for sulfatase activity
MELSMIKKIFLMVFMVSLVASILMAQEVTPGKVEAIDLGKGIKLEMVFIPAGKFKMGSPETEKGRQKMKLNMM